MARRITVSLLKAVVSSSSRTSKRFAGAALGGELPADPPSTQLFCSQPSLEILQRGWREDAVFEDPIAIAVGFKQYAAQWFGMPKAFPQSETVAWKVTKNEPGLIELCVFLRPGSEEGANAGRG